MTHSQPGRQRICFIVSSPITSNAFLIPQVKRLSAEYDITLCMNAENSDVVPIIPPGVALKALDIRRKIDLLADIRALFALWGFFVRERFDLVFSVSPKAGLLSMVAAWLARVPHRVHCFTGQVWINRRGVGRQLFKLLDRIMTVCATHILVDGRSQRQFLIDEGVVKPEKAVVLAETSLICVDVERFRPNSDARQRVRQALGIEEAACCVIYVGRLDRDKGIEDLVAAFQQLRIDHPSLRLLIVGPDEAGLEPFLRTQAGILLVGYTREVQDYMAAADILCLPSYREGFGQVLIEAGAVGLPVLGSRISGISDAVIEGKTGLMHRMADVEDIRQQLGRLITDGALRESLGRAGQMRAVERFAVDRLVAALYAYIRQILG